MLGNDVVFLRALEAEDLDFLYALENDADLWGVSDTLAPVSRHLLRQYLEHAGADFHQVRQLRLVIGSQATGQAVGTVDLFDFSPLHQRAGVGITVLAAARRHGYAHAALQLLLPYARHTLRLHQLYCSVATRNRASQQLFEKIGFSRVGVRRQWLHMADGWQDVVEYQYVFSGIDELVSGGLRAG
ncbi:GNAT family N-acetyltransferase [Hymenobacter lutimineralis]|uniref:GNAT family N-acetyltransferase n=1 Tax=Hymenobacter lutimineralis TaxID=2606448 RepID=A0A5D6VCP1_9BACT|nr:GNAT family protein [Hymenobacter lutimineralis]TYZ13266.1 GNAT family N-acetyltransferase [Hymenobacter lutimineralis]